MLAHELAHVRDRDILISSIAAMLGRCSVDLRPDGFRGGGRRRGDDAISGIVAILSPDPRPDRGDADQDGYPGSRIPDRRFRVAITGQPSTWPAPSANWRLVPPASR